MAVTVISEVDSRIVATGNDNLITGGILSAKGFKTVKEVFQDIAVKTLVLEYWKNHVETVQSGAYRGSKDAGSIVTSAILDHPKILLEHDDFADVIINPHFKDVQALKLPFPKMVVVVGEPYDDIKKIVPEHHRQTADYGDGHLRYFFSFCASQLSDESVCVIVPMVGRQSGKGIFLVEIHLSYGETPTGEPKILTVIPLEQRSWISQYEISKIARYLSEAIYMMTLNPATAQACISIPTKEESDKNKKRIRKGKKPLIEFKLITIDGKKPEQPKAPPLGTHASPKQHWRRGHWRHYASGKIVFIDLMLVGDEKNGKIVKDYAVGLYDDAKNKRVQQGTR
jgi:hypothetical protein